VREIRTLRAMWRALETELRQLLNGHEEGNFGYMPRRSLRATAPVLDPTNGRAKRHYAVLVVRPKTCHTTLEFSAKRLTHSIVIPPEPTWILTKEPPPRILPSM
jgi:hypothetical protein